MYWKIICESVEKDWVEPSGKTAGRFVLHKHRDDDGEHLDLRLEHGDHLVGWRIASTSLDAESWATEKQPHPTRWLTDVCEAERLDWGEYSWETFEPGEKRLRLFGQDCSRLLRVEPLRALTSDEVRDVVEALEHWEARPSEAARLIGDGVTARKRAVERLCGLGRELDGDSFDVTLWRRAIAGLNLDEIHGHLRAFEHRFDLKYPPQPVTQPEPLPDEENEERASAALSILRE